jgi:Golgi phosphoprotein 3
MEPGLPDELLLLALHDERGSVVRAAAPVLNGALVGAVMMELSLRGHLSEGTGHQLIAAPTPTGDEILDDVRQRIADADRRQDARSWVSQLSRELPNLEDRLLDRMVAAGVLEQRDHRVLWVFPTRRYPLADGAVEQQARDRIRAVVLEGEAPDARMAALISLVQACNLLDEVFAPDERAAARRRIVELIAGRPAEGGTIATGLGADALFGLVGATLQDAYDNLSQSLVTGGTYRRAYWDVDILQPWLSDSVFVSSGDSWPSSAWEERAPIETASVGTGSSDSTWTSSAGSISPWLDDSGSSGGGASESDSSSGGWSWWWGGSDSSSDNSSNNDSGSSWWDSGSSDNSSSDSGGWDSGSSDSNSDYSSSSC